MILMITLVQERKNLVVALLKLNKINSHSLIKKEVVRNISEYLMKKNNRKQRFDLLNKYLLHYYVLVNH